MCWYDTKQIKRVVLNLLSNAFKYTPEGEEIVLAIEEKEDQVQLKITDTGQSISKESLPHIFKRFYQAGESSSKEPDTGIGLALTKGLVELHHGTIDVLSATGYGTVFTACLPQENVFANDDYVTLISSSEQPSSTITDAVTLAQEQREQFASVSNERGRKRQTLYSDNRRQ